MAGFHWGIIRGQYRVIELCGVFECGVKVKILIAVSTYNRPFITELCLANLNQARDEDIRIVVYDDFSTSYDEEALKKYADEVVRFPTNAGIARSRAKAFRDFIYRFPDYDLLYLTDNDALHDPCFPQVLRGLFTRMKSQGVVSPVGLFNSNAHNQEDNIFFENDVLYVSKSLPGISQCFDRELAGKIVDNLNESPVLEFMWAWDYNFIMSLGQSCLLSKVSYVEHFARDRFEGGLHAPCSGLGTDGLADFERDRAINPTPYLVALREEVIKRILY